MATDTTKTTTSTEETSRKDGKQITLAAKGVDQGNLILINKEHSYDFPTVIPSWKVSTRNEIVPTASAIWKYN